MVPLAPPFSSATDPGTLVAVEHKPGVYPSTSVCYRYGVQSCGCARAAVSGVLERVDLCRDVVGCLSGVLCRDMEVDEEAFLEKVEETEFGEYSECGGVMLRTVHPHKGHFCGSCSPFGAGTSERHRLVRFKNGTCIFLILGARVNIVLYCRRLVCLFVGIITVRVFSTYLIYTYVYHT